MDSCSSAYFMCVGLNTCSTPAQCFSLYPHCKLINIAIEDTQKLPVPGYNSNSATFPTGHRWHIDRLRASNSFPEKPWRWYMSPEHVVLAQLLREVISFNSGICFEEYKSLLRRLFVSRTAAQGMHWSFTSLSGNSSKRHWFVKLLYFLIFTHS